MHANHAPTLRSFLKGCALVNLDTKRVFAQGELLCIEVYTELSLAHILEWLPIGHSMKPTNGFERVPPKCPSPQSASPEKGIPEGARKNACTLQDV